MPGSTVEISTTPVTRADYMRFAQETRRPIPQQRGSPGSPVTWVTAADADALAEWLSGGDRRSYRLPTLHEMRALAVWARARPHIWPCRSTGKGHLPQRDQGYLSEWLTCSPVSVGGGTQMRCIAHAAWLLANRPTVAHGALVDRRHSFVTFRLVRVAEMHGTECQECLNRMQRYEKGGSAHEETADNPA